MGPFQSRPFCDSVHDVTVTYRAFGTPTHHVILHTLPKHLQLRMPNSGCWMSSEQSAARERIAEPPLLLASPHTLQQGRETAPRRLHVKRRAGPLLPPSHDLRPSGSARAAAPGPSRGTPRGGDRCARLRRQSAPEARPKPVPRCHPAGRSRAGLPRGGGGGDYKEPRPGRERGCALGAAALVALGRPGPTRCSEYGRQHGRFGCKCRGKAGRSPFSRAGPRARCLQTELRRGLGAASRRRSVRAGRDTWEVTRPTERRGPQPPPEPAGRPGRLGSGLRGVQGVKLNSQNRRGCAKPGGTRPPASLFSAMPEPLVVS